MAGYLLGRVFGLPAYRDKTTALVLTAQETIYKTILVLLTFTAILWMSIFFYATFYYTYMPAISHIRPVHLQYSSCGRQHGLCTFPSANVTLTRKQQLLMTGQSYRILVELEMPESLSNQHVGMFMVCGELKDEEGISVEKSCRSAILHYKSFFHHVIATFVYAPFLLSGSAEEKQIVPVELFSGFQENPNRPATQALIEIQSQHVEIYRAYLKIHADFTGLRYFMFHWPVLSGGLGIMTSFFVLTVIAFLSWYKLFISRQQVIQVGYDGDAARVLEERRAAAKERLLKEREKMQSHQIAEDDQEDVSKEKLGSYEKKVKDNNVEDDLDKKSKLEEPEVKRCDKKSQLEEPEIKQSDEKFEEAQDYDASSSDKENGKETTSDSDEERRSSEEFEMLSEVGDNVVNEIKNENAEGKDTSAFDSEEQPTTFKVKSEPEDSTTVRQRTVGSSKPDTSC